MKHANTIALTGAVICLVGCAAPTKVAVLGPIGPAPTAQAQNRGNGYLQVYSARQEADIDVNREEWLWNDDFGRNGFLYDTAETGYAIYNHDGKLRERVSNLRNQSGLGPALVSLPPGLYEVRAEAEDHDSTIEVKFPVVIQAGRTTTAHLVSGWKPRHHYTDDEVVRLPDGDIAGWLAVR